MHIAARAYANEAGQIFRRKFEFDYFRKTTQNKTKSKQRKSQNINNDS